MQELLDVLDFLQPLVFGGLAVVAIVQWRRRGGQAAAYLAATFACLGTVVMVAPFVQEQSVTIASTWVRKLEVVLIVLFPYFLWRFSLSFALPARRFFVAAHVMTGAALAGALILDVPTEGRPRSVAFQIFVYLLLLQWVVLSARVVQRLWRAGSDQPAVARRRMRTLSLGAVGLALALVIGGVATSGEMGAVELLTQILAVCSGPLFLLGFAPPAIVRTAWRRPEEVALREAETRLMRAEEPDQVAAVMLPHVARLMGAGGAVLADRNGKLVSSYGIGVEEAQELVAEATSRAPNFDGSGSVLSVPLSFGRLVVRASPYTPFFGDEEIGILQDLATLADLALARAELIQHERQISTELRAMNEAMRDFLAVASHDLRTPLTLIQGFAGVLESQWDALPDHEKREHIGTIGRQARLLTRLVNDLLTVSRIDAGALELNKEVLDVADIVNEAVEGIETEGHPPWIVAPVGLMVGADGDHLRRILRNFVQNAFTYGSPPVEIEAHPDGEWVEVRVRDRGTGVPDEFRPHLFEKFSRSDEARAKARTGTGLGLSIARGLAEANGGEVWYEPNDGEGACFAIRLPRENLPSSRSE